MKIISFLDISNYVFNTSVELIELQEIVIEDDLNLLLSKVVTITNARLKIAIDSSIKNISDMPISTSIFADNFEKSFRPKCYFQWFRDSPEYRQMIHLRILFLL